MPMHDFIDCAQKEKDIAKCKKNQNAFTWLQACFLREVRVIWYKSLGDRHYQTNVIDDVGNFFDYYLFITFSVLSTLTSCTYYTQIFAKFCTYNCVLTNLAIFNCIWFDV